MGAGEERRTVDLYAPSGPEFVVMACVDVARYAG
jgi:hypothetical protein